MSFVQVVGAAFIVIGVVWLAMYVWLRFATERTLRELREAYAYRPSILESWEEPTVLPAPYDWQRRGDFDG
jgi:hypothetical protein